MYTFIWFGLNTTIFDLEDSNAIWGSVAESVNAFKVTEKHYYTHGSQKKKNGGKKSVSLLLLVGSKNIFCRFNDRVMYSRPPSLSLRKT